MRADRAYGSRANRDCLRRRGIHCTIPEKADQIRNRKKLGARGGRPTKFAKADYRERHAVELGKRVSLRLTGHLACGACISPEGVTGAWLAVCRRSRPGVRHHSSLSRALMSWWLATSPRKRRTS